MPQATQMEMAELAEQLVTAVRQCKLLHEKNADWGIVTVSVGGAFASAAEGSIAPLFRAADQHLYQAKSKGRNRFEQNQAAAQVERAQAAMK